MAALLLFGITASPAAAQSEPQTVGKVTGLAATTAGQADGTVRLAWNAADNAQVYMVLFLKHDDVMAGNYANGQMRAFTATQGAISGLDGGAKYYFIARGMRFNWTDFSEALGDWSIVQSATPAQIPGREYLYEAIQPPMAPAYIDWRWDTGQAGFRKLSTDFTIHNDVGDWSDQHGLYLILLQNDISGAGFYFGLQTDANGRGKGVIFSRWQTDDLANARWDETDGWYELGRHEGGFLGVRRSYDWSAGDYRIRIAPDALESDGEWFGLWITDLATGETTWIGSLKFPLNNDGRATFNPRASATIELYGNPQIRPVDVPQWHVSVKRPLGDGVPATWGSTSYPWDASENALFNSDVRYDESEDAAHLRVGGLTERKDSAVSRIDFKPLAFFTDLEHADWLEQNKPALANQIKALPWVATGVADSEREAAEQLIRAARWYPDTFNILMEMSWVQDNAVTADEAQAIFQMRWLAQYHPEQSEQISQKPWVQDSITTAEARVIFYLAWTIRYAPTLGKRMLNLPWIQDDSIADHEASVIDGIYHVHRYAMAPALAERMIELSWIQDGITADEGKVIEHLRRGVEDTPEQTERMIELSWVQDDITADEAKAIEYLRRIGRSDSEAAADIITMPFLKTLEIDDVLALHALSNPRHDDTLDVILEHPTLGNGITDDLTTLVTAVGIIREAGEVRRMLNPGYADIEVLAEGTVLSPDLKISIVRTENPSWDGAAQGLKFAVDLVEGGMQLPLPVPHLIVVIHDLAITHEGPGAQFHSFAIGIHTRNEKPVRYASGKDVLHSTYTHEVAHYYFNSAYGESWLNEGVATTFEYIYRLEGRSPSEVPQDMLQINRRGDCDAHDLKMHTERGKSAKSSCKYYLNRSQGETRIGVG